MSQDVLVDEIGVPLKAGGLFTKADGTQIQIHHSNPKKDLKGRWLPGTSGNMTGRTRGKTRKINVQTKMDELDCCPFTVLAHIAKGDQAALKEKEPVPLGQRRSAATELCKYLAPQRKAVDIEADVRSDEKGRTVVILPSNGRESSSQLEKLIEEDSIETEYEVDPDCGD